MLEYWKEYFMTRDIELMVADFLCLLAVVYYIPKGLIWWFTTKNPRTERDPAQDVKNNFYDYM